MRCSSNDMLRIAWTNCGTNKKVLRIQETTKKLLLTIKEIIEIFQTDNEERKAWEI